MPGPDEEGPTLNDLTGGSGGRYVTWAELVAMLDERDMHIRSLREQMDNVKDSLETIVDTVNNHADAHEALRELFGHLVNDFREIGRTLDRMEETRGRMAPGGE